MKNYKHTAPNFEIKSNGNELERVKITSSQDSYDFAKQFYHDDISIYESFFICLLDRSNTTIGWAKIGQGGVSGVMVDAKLVAHFAVQSLASGVILVHNHPSGQMRPSQADKNITKKLMEGLKMLDIKVLDHLILMPNGGYYSFVDEGIL